MLRNDVPFIDLRSGEKSVKTYEKLQDLTLYDDDVMRVQVVIKKRAFLDELGANANTHCFVSGALLRRYLARELSELADLWPAGADGLPNRSVATIHTPSNVAFDGRLLRIGMGYPLGSPDADPGDEVQALRFQDHGALIATRGVDLGGLTPTHLARRTESPSEPSELHAHLSRVALVLVSDIARGAGSEVTVAFRSGNLHASVVLPADATAAYPSEVVKLSDWVYQCPADPGAADPFHDRLAVAQTVLARDLQPVKADRRFDFLVGDERPLYAEILASWKSYVADKIDAHVTKRIELEKEVSAAVEEFGERTSKLVSDLASAMAGVVAFGYVKLSIPYSQGAEAASMQVLPFVNCSSNL